MLINEPQKIIILFLISHTYWYSIELSLKSDQNPLLSCCFAVSTLSIRYYYSGMLQVNIGCTAVICNPDYLQFIYTH